MKKAFLLALSLLGASSMWAQTSPYTGSEVAAGDFFLYNVETGLWLQNNNRQTVDWNSHAELDPIGFDWGFIANGDGWQINPKLGNNHSMNASNLYLDTRDAVTVWTLTPIQGSVSNAYSIKSGDVTLGANADKFLQKTTENSTWQLVTAAERLSVQADQYASASVDNPIDLSWMIPGGQFNIADEHADGLSRTIASGTGAPFVAGQTQGNGVREIWNNVNGFDINYTLTGLPYGVYEFTVSGYYRNGPVEVAGSKYHAGTEQLLAEYYANAESLPFKSICAPEYTSASNGCNVNSDGIYIPDNIGDAAIATRQGLYVNTPIKVIVTDGTLKIGARKNGGADKDWTILDYFQLKYLGEPDITEFTNALTTAIEKAEAFSGNTTTALQNALATALSEAKAVVNSKDTDVLSAKTSALNEARLNAEAVNDAYLAFAVVKANAQAVLASSTAENDVISALNAAITTQSEAVEAATDNAGINAAASALESAILTYVGSATANTEAGINLTFVVKNADFSNSDTEWDVTPQQGGNYAYTNGGWERWHHASDPWRIQQTINDVPNGVYRVTVRSTDRLDDGTTEHAYLFAQGGNRTTALISTGPKDGHGFPETVNDLNADDNFGLVETEVFVTNGTITFGIEHYNHNTWLVYDNFGLYFLHPVSLADFTNALNAAITEAEAFKGVTTDVLASALATALQEAKAVTESTDPSELSAKTDALNQALDNARNNDISVFIQTLDLAEAEGVDVVAAKAALASANTAADLNNQLEALRTARKIKALGGAADIYTGSAPVADTEYYFFNLGTGMWLSAGSDWNTHAAVDQAGWIFKLNAADQGFTITCSMGSFNASPYVDTGVNTVYKFEAVAGKTNVYNILEGTDLLGYNPDGKTDGKKYWSSVSNVAGADAADLNYQWKLVTKAERDALVETATAANPVDATYLINNPSLLRKPDYGMWTKEVNGGNGGARVSSQDDGNGDRAADFGWEVWNADNFKYYQTLTGLKPGLYEVSAQGFWREGDGGNQANIVNNGGTLNQKAYVFANDKQTLLPNIASCPDFVPGVASQGSVNGSFPNWPREAFEYFETGAYKATVQAVVGASGELIIGVAADEKVAYGDWVVFDNFRLTYLGPVAESIDVTITDAKYATFVAPFEAEMPAGVTANTATVSGETIVLTPVEGKVAAHTPVILSAEAAKEFQVSGYPTVAPAELKNGALTGTYTEIEAPEGSYVLQSQNGKVGFYLVDQAVATPKVGANRAYLTAPSGDGNVKAYLLGDLETAIKALETADMKDAVIFNLAGQRVGKAVKGIYIVNGKKAVVK